MKNILVVDDSLTMRQMVKASLRGLSDCDFEEAASGVEAIERLSQKPIDLMVLDLNMPGMDGLDVVRYVRGHEAIRDIPIIVLSGGGDENSLEAPLAVGASCCLAKPVEPAALMERVRKLLTPDVAEGQMDHTEETAAFEEFMDDYFAECDKHLTLLHKDLPELEKQIGQATADTELVNEVFRSFHTLHGLSGMLGVVEAELLAGKMEYYLRTLRQGKGCISSVGVHSLIRGIHMLNRVVTARRDNQPPPAIADVLDELDYLVSQPQTGAVPSTPLTAGEQAAVAKAREPQRIGEIQPTAVPELGGRVWQVLFNPSPALFERGVNVSVIRDRLKHIGGVIQVVPRAMEGERIAFEFLLAGGDATEAALATWGEDGVTYSPHIPNEPKVSPTAPPPSTAPSADAPKATYPETAPRDADTADESITAANAVVPAMLASQAAAEGFNTQAKPISKSECPTNREKGDKDGKRNEITNRPAMPSNTFLLFRVDEGLYALDVAAVERAVFAAEVSPLPNAPRNVLGLINIAGEIMPVVDARGCLGCPARDMELSDRFIVAQASERRIAVRVDGVEGVVELSGDATAGEEGPATVATMAENIVLIQDVDVFLPEAINIGKLQRFAHAS